MDIITQIALFLALSGAGLYAVYVTVRKAVKDGIRDARETEAEPPAPRQP